jgi:integral membrane protein (TIGR01906 family)
MEIKRMNRLKNIAGITSLFLFILTGAIALTILFVPLYQFTVWAHELPQFLGMSYERIMENYYVLLRYLHFPWIQELNFPDFPSSEAGLFHFWEVKILFYINYAVLFVSGIASFFYVRYVKRNQLFWKWVKPFFVATWVPVGLLVFLAISFDRLFVLFHLLLFDNDYWLFNPATDPVINALPQEFFMYCFIFAFIVIELTLVFIYRYSKKHAFQ